MLHFEIGNSTAVIINTNLGHVGISYKQIIKAYNNKTVMFKKLDRDDLKRPEINIRGLFYRKHLVVVYH